MDNPRVGRGRENAYPTLKIILMGVYTCGTARPSTHASITRASNSVWLGRGKRAMDHGRL